MTLLVRLGAEAQAFDRWAAFSDPAFQNYSQTDGLPNPVATALAEDADGFLWVGTQGGLARWDGYRFRSYKPHTGDPGALPDGWVTALHTDPSGVLWIGTTGGGLTRYDREHDRFIKYPTGVGGLSDVHVSAIIDDGASGLWVATDGGVNHLEGVARDAARGSAVTVEVSHHKEGSADSLPDDRVLSLLLDREGNLWVGTRNGLARRAAGSRNFVGLPLGFAGEAVAVWSLFEDAEGRIWLGTTRHGAFVISPHETQPMPVADRAIDVGYLKNDWVFSIGAGAPGEVWLGTYGDGIIVVDAATGRTRHIVNQPTLPSSLASDTVWALHTDRSGGIWAGTFSGVGRLRTNGDSVFSIPATPGQPNRLSQSDVVSIMPGADGRVWAGLRSKGIDILDPISGKLINLASDSRKPETALPQISILSMARWPTGEMFIGTAAGLYRADPSGANLARMVLPGRDRAARNHDLTVAAGRLWVGDNDDGLWSFTPAGGVATDVKHLDSAQLTDRRVVTLVPGASNDLWIGTRNGLNRLDLGTLAVECISPNAKDLTSLAAGFISSLVLDHAGRLWVGTLGGGIQVLVGRDHGRPVFRRIEVEQGLPDANVDALLTDAQGRIWVTTDAGIAVVDPSTFSVQPLSAADGAPTGAYWVHAAAALSSGELFFGSSGSGIIVARPDRFRVWDYRPPVVVTEVRVGGKVVPGNWSNRGVGNATLLVRPENNSLAVEFSSLDFSAPQANRYAYRLDGFDKGWIETDATRRLAAYTNLPPGNYVLQVRGSNRNGDWSEATLSLPIRVLPAWFQTIWFTVIVVLVALGFLLALVQGRTAYLLRRQVELESQVSARTAELEESKRQIERIAYYDVLTGLPNRRQFNLDVGKLIGLADRQGQRFALLLIDLDRFKQINDTLGHDAGDALLVETARRLRLAVRVSDSVARLGGDEFAILLGDLPDVYPSIRGAIEAICSRVVHGLDEAIEFSGTTMKIGASVGVALYPEHNGNLEALYKEADLALYEAKGAGKNTWRWQGKESIDVQP